MPTSTRSTGRCSVRALLIIVSLVSACSHWTTVNGSVDQIIRDKEPKRMLVTRSNNSTIELERPSISGDSVVGFARMLYENARIRVAIPLEDVKRVQVRAIEPFGTFAIIAGLGITAAAIIQARGQDPPRPRPESFGGSSNEPISCPLVYSWNGQEWLLDSGTFGGAFLRPLRRTDLDNLDYAREANGILKLKLANELQETDYIDALSVLVVDHEPGVTVSPDGFGVPRALGELNLPISAVDTRGHDALARISSRDGWNWESSLSGRDPSVAADLRDGLELEFVRESGARSARLVVDGNNTPWAAHLMQEYVRLHGRDTQAWYDSLDAEPERALKFGETLAREAFLSVAVWTGDGWEQQGLIWEAGPEIVKRQVFSLDLSRVSGDNVRIRLESVPSFWLIDHVAIDYSPERPFTVHEVFAESAIDGSGRDVRAFLSAIDENYLVFETGEYAELLFRVPDVPENRERTYLLRTNGWYHIHSFATGEPDVESLDRIANEPGAIARLSIERMNRALSTMAMASAQP